MSVKIAVTSPSFSKHPILQKEIRAAFDTVVLNESGERLKGEKLHRFVGDADGVVVGLEAVDSEFIASCTNLKIVSKYGVGLDNIDKELCGEKGIAIGWTGGVNRLSVAEMALGFMLGLKRNLYPTSVQLKDGVWNKSGGEQLTGKTVGIIGVGHIGKEVVRLLQPFNCRILVNDIIPQQEYYEEYKLEEVSKEYIYANADIITIHTPLTEETKNLIDDKALAAMKQNSILINTARGGIVNEDALRDALQKGSIAGAALDVFETEPPEDAELVSLPNLYCTPHIGGNANEAVLAMGRSAISHLKEYFYAR